MRATAAMLLLFSGAVSAANVNDAADFQKTKGSTELYWYLQGAMAGYSVVNASLESDGRPMMYCQPRALSNSGLDLVKIVEQQLPIAAKSYGTGLTGLPIEFVLLDALEINFPCK